VTFSVFGASGSIGSCLVTSLRQTGIDTYEADPDEETVYTRDLGNVVYCIGLTAGFRSRPFKTVDAHVGVLRSLLERATFSSFLYLSSTRVYRGLETGREDDPLVVNPTDPDDLYNVSKLLGEALCLSLPSDTIRVVRLSNVVGPGAVSESFVNSLVTDAIERGIIELETHPDSTKNYVDIRDVVDLIRDVATAGQKRLYNIAGASSTTHREIVDLLEDATGCDTVTRAEAPLAMFPPIAIDRVREEFGFAPRGIAESLTDMVAARQMKARLRE
jgi:nucleoside-diphosphate-sugar epimerase